MTKVSDALDSADLELVSQKSGRGATLVRCECLWLRQTDRGLDPEADDPQRVASGNSHRDNPQPIDRGLG